MTGELDSGRYQNSIQALGSTTFEKIKNVCTKNKSRHDKYNSYFRDYYYQLN